MRTKNYKTLRGLLKQTQQLTVEQLFSGRFATIQKGGSISGSMKKQSERQLKSLPSIFYRQINAGRIWSRRCWMVVGIWIISSAFTLTTQKKYGVYCNNSLSGEAFDYCKRMYLKNIANN